jgi:hypothetical protein
MLKYLFLDNWVFSLLTDPLNERGLLRFVRAKNYTVVITVLSLVELYNPREADVGRDDRVARACEFLSQVPCVIVDPVRVHDEEIKANLAPLERLPVQLDLRQIAESRRASSLLALLRADEMFVKQGKDIHAWVDDCKRIKAGWLADVNYIIEDALRKGNLVRHANGGFVTSREQKENFLLSLDLRFARPEHVDAILIAMSERGRAGQPVHLTGVRLSSLCFWYAYVDIDTANQLRRNGSDVVDILHISLLPYCSAFALDKSMRRMLDRIREPIVPVRCDLITHTELRKILAWYS